MISSRSFWRRNDFVSRNLGRAKLGDRGRTILRRRPCWPERQQIAQTENENSPLQLYRHIRNLPTYKITVLRAKSQMMGVQRATDAVAAHLHFLVQDSCQLQTLLPLSEGASPDTMFIAQSRSDTCVRIALFSNFKQETRNRRLAAGPVERFQSNQVMSAVRYQRGRQCEFDHPVIALFSRL